MKNICRPSLVFLQLLTIRIRSQHIAHIIKERTNGFVGFVYVRQEIFGQHFTVGKTAFEPELLTSGLKRIGNDLDDVPEILKNTIWIEIMDTAGQVLKKLRRIGG